MLLGQYIHNGLAAEQLASGNITNASDDKAKLDPQTTTHRRTHKRRDMSSNASVAWMALVVHPWTVETHRVFCQWQ